MNGGWILKSNDNMKSKQKIIIIALLAIVTISSCGKVNCDQDCFTPPGPISFRVMNDTIDLIYNKSISEDSITLYYMDGDNIIDTEIDIYTDTVQEYSRIHSNVITWKSVEGHRDFYLRLGYDDIEEIYLVVESVTSDCCTFHPIMDIEINGNQPPFNDISYSFIINKDSK